MSEAKLKIDSKTTLILDDKTGFLRITGTNTGQDGHEYYYDHGYDLSAANSDQLELFTMALNSFIERLLFSNGENN